MNEWYAFFAMGGYADFVWPCYIIATLVLAGGVVLSRRKRCETLTMLRRYYHLHRDDYDARS